MNSCKIEDFEHTQKSNQFIDYIFDSTINADWRPRQRIFDQRPCRTPQQVAEDLEKKLQESSIRRQNHINNIVERSRQQVSFLSQINISDLQIDT